MTFMEALKQSTSIVLLLLGVMGSVLLYGWLMSLLMGMMPLWVGIPVAIVTTLFLSAGLTALMTD